MTTDTPTEEVAGSSPFDDFKTSLISQCDTMLNTDGVSDDEKGKVARLRSRVIIDL